MILDFNKIKKGEFYLLELPLLKEDIFTYFSNASNLLSIVDYNSDISSFFLEYSNFKIEDFLNTFENDINKNFLKSTFFKPNFYIKDLSKIGLFCFYALEKIKNNDVVFFDLDALSYNSQYLSCQFLKSISVFFKEKNFIVMYSSKKFKITNFKQEDDLIKFFNDTEFYITEDYENGFYIKIND